MFGMTAKQKFEARSRGGLKAGQNAIKSGHLSRAGRKGGKTSGDINAKSGWMKHIALIRHHKNHNDCPYCNPKFSANRGS
jgi:ribosomal protein L19E